MGVIIQAASLVAGESRKGTATEGVSEPVCGARDGGGRVSERVIHHSVTYACTRECPEIIEWERRNRFSSVMRATEIFVRFSGESRTAHGKAGEQKNRSFHDISTLKMLMRLFATTIVAFESA